MSTSAVNPYEISMEELARLATTTPTDPIENPTQPRDDRGRFVSPEPIAPESITPEGVTEQPEHVTVEEFYHREEIDIGEGGKQVFTGIGPSPEEAVADCLRQVVEAQKHATRKIRELAHQPERVVQPVQPNPDEEATLALSILSAPTEVIRQVMERELGMSVKDAKAKLQQADELVQAREGDRVAKEFMAKHPEYYMDPRNANRIERYMQLNGLPLTVESIEKSFTDLSSDGLLVQKPTEAPAPARSRSSGVNVRETTPPVITPTDELKKAYEMPMDQLLQKAGGFLRR